MPPGRTSSHTSRRRTSPSRLSTTLRAGSPMRPRRRRARCRRISPVPAVLPLTFPQRSRQSLTQSTRSSIGQRSRNGLRPRLFRRGRRPRRQSPNQHLIKPTSKLPTACISRPAPAFWHDMSGTMTRPVGQGELWHTRLGVRGTHGQTHDDNDPTDANLRTVRAIWSDDYDSNNPFTAPPKFSTGVSYYNPYRSSLDADDRYQITRLTSDFTGKWYSNDQTGDYVPSPAGVNRLALSTLGAWMNVRGYWDPQLQDLDLLEWEHKATMARDHYVKVVLAGYLFPFGHKAALVKITERKFTRTLQATGAPGPIVAYLRQRMFILVREPVKTFKGPHDPGAPSPPDYPPADQTKADGAGNWKEGYEGRQMPFKSVQITTLVTPDIEDPGKTPASAIKPPSGFTTYSGFGATDAFWPLIPVNGKDVDFLWHLVGTDWDGNSVAFTCPLIFLSEIMSSYIPKQIQKPKPPVPAFSNYKNLTQWILPVYESAVYQGLASPAPAKATVQMHGAKIAIAPSAPSTNGLGTDPAVE